MTHTPRKPIAYVSDHHAVQRTHLPPENLELQEQQAAPASSRPWPWGKLFIAAAMGLLSLSFSLSITQLLEALFAQSLALGWLGAALLALLLIALIAFVTREVSGLRRLVRAETLQQQAHITHATKDRATAEQTTRALLDHYAARPDMANKRGQMQQYLTTIMDGDDLLRLAERTLLSDLDAKATRMVMDSARRISVVTALSPRAFFDILMVIVEASRLIRRLADMYGARPGTMGMMRLIRAVLGHLVLTGGMAMGENLIQQVVGQGLAARLSAKLGEGIINGMMTARIGLATIDLVRPLPFLALQRPKLTDVATQLLKSEPEIPPHIPPNNRILE